MHKFWNKTFCIDSRNFVSEMDLILDIPAVLEMSTTLLVYMSMCMYIFDPRTENLKFSKDIHQQNPS